MVTTHAPFKNTGAIIGRGTINFSANNASPSVSGGNVFKVAQSGNTGTVSILNFDGSQNGQVITVLPGTNTVGHTQIDPGAGEYLMIGGTVVMTGRNTLTMVAAGSQWFEIGRGSAAY